ncbi:hypothetical protein GCM10023085_02860 [Actinomadura viridis]
MLWAPWAPLAGFVGMVQNRPRASARSGFRGGLPGRAVMVATAIGSGAVSGRAGRARGNCQGGGPEFGSISIRADQMNGSRPVAIRVMAVTKRGPGVGNGRSLNV